MWVFCDARCREENEALAQAFVDALCKHEEWCACEAPSPPPRHVTVMQVQAVRFLWSGQRSCVLHRACHLNAGKLQAAAAGGGGGVRSALPLTVTQGAIKAEDKAKHVHPPPPPHASPSPHDSPPRPSAAFSLSASPSPPPSPCLMCSARSSTPCEASMLRSSPASAIRLLQPLLPPANLHNTRLHSGRTGTYFHAQYPIHATVMLSLHSRLR